MRGKRELRIIIQAWIKRSVSISHNNTNLLNKIDIIDEVRGSFQRVGLGAQVGHGIPS